MSLKIYDDSKNYTAQVIKLPVKQKIEGLDNLVQVEVFGNNCLIGKDSPEDQLYLFFAAGTRLSTDFLKSNNLYRDSILNVKTDEKGFFEENGRVKAIKFHGTISSGFVIPITSLKNIVAYFGKDISLKHIDELKEHDQFNEIDGMEICRKYFVPVNQPAGSKGDKVAKINNQLVDLMIPNQFRFHDETTHLANNYQKLNDKDIIVITDKWHGSSCILSKVYINRKLNMLQKLFNKLGANIPNKEY